MISNPNKIMECPFCGEKLIDSRPYCKACGKFVGIRKNNSGKVQPVFEVDRYFSTVCKSHSNYSNLIANVYSNQNLVFDDSNKINPYMHPFMARFLPSFYQWCKTCEHYKNDNCYFSSPEIDKIYKDHGVMLGLFFNKYKCEICSCQIKNAFNTMRTIYLKKSTGKVLSLLCTGCIFGIENNRIGRKILTFLSLSSMLLSIIIVMVIILNFLAFSSGDIALIWTMLISTSIPGVIGYFLVKRMIKLAMYKKTVKNYQIISNSRL
jgi:hypothetical protein